MFVRGVRAPRPLDPPLPLLLTVTIHWFLWIDGHLCRRSVRFSHRPYRNSAVRSAFGQWITEMDWLVINSLPDVNAPPPPHSVLFRVRICVFPPFKNTPPYKVRCVKSIRAGFLCTTSRTLVREKYPFTGHFGNTHAVIPTPEWGGGGRVSTPWLNDFSSFWPNSNDTFIE